MRLVVGFNKVLNDIHSAHCAAVKKISPYPNIDCAIEPLHYCRLMLAFTGKVLNTVALYLGLEVRVKELVVHVGL